MSLTSLNEWLEKQSPAMLEAKRRGLVPQSGNWEKPRRWVRPEEVGEVEESHEDYSWATDELYMQASEFMTLKHNNLMEGDGEQLIEEMGETLDTLREGLMGDRHHHHGIMLYNDWVEGMFAKIVGLRAILLENEGKEISRDLVAQQMGAVNKEGEADYKQVDFAISFGKTMLQSIVDRETMEVSIQPTLDVLAAEQKFAVERTKELFGDEIEVFRCMYGDHVPALKKQLEEEGELEIEEFPLSSYTHDIVAALGFCLGQGANQPHMIFSRTIKAEDVMASWYSNPAILSGMPEQKEVVISSKEGKFTINKDSIIG